MESSLKKPTPRKFSPRCAIQNGLHKSGADAMILSFRINRNRTDTANRRALIQAVASHNLPAKLRDHRIESWMGEHLGEQTDCYVRIGQVRREAVMRIDLCECFIADTTAFGGVLWLRHSYRRYVRNRRYR